MINNDFNANINDDQPQNPSNDQPNQEETPNSSDNLVHQDIDENYNTNNSPTINQEPITNQSNDNNNDNNNTSESTTYSHKPENSRKQPLIIRLRNPAPDLPMNNANGSQNSTDKKEKIDNDDSNSEIPDEDKWKCPICLDALQQPVVTRCGHVFCWPCIHEWLRRSNTCPVCHGEIEESHLIPIYGQGDEADISSPPPPKPEYREARSHNEFNIAFGNITNQMYTLFHPGPYLIIQIFAIIFLFFSFFV